MKLLKRWYSNISRLLLLLSLSILSSCSENIKWLPKLACNIVMSEFGQEYFFNRSNLDRLEYHHFQNEEAIHAFFKEDERLSYTRTLTLHLMDKTHCYLRFLLEVQIAIYK